MGPQDLRRHYEQLTDDELLSVAAGSGHLVPEAAAELNSEIRRRGAKLPEPTQWMREPGSAERVESLEDYDQYRRLCQKRQFMGNYWYVLAMAPFVLGLVLGRSVFENSVLLIGLTVTWAMLVAMYGLALVLRWIAFRCPQCSHRFGTDAACSSCGFPRSPKQQLRSL
jgi:hypothetical protein